MLPAFKSSHCSPEGTGHYSVPLNTGPLPPRRQCSLGSQGPALTHLCLVAFQLSSGPPEDTKLIKKLEGWSHPQVCTTGLHAGCLWKKLMTSEGHRQPPRGGGMGGGLGFVPSAWVLGSVGSFPEIVTTTLVCPHARLKCDCLSSHPRLALLMMILEWPFDLL